MRVDNLPLKGLSHLGVCKCLGRENFRNVIRGIRVGKVGFGLLYFPM